MFVKVYEYHIQKDKINEFLSIQEKSTEVYGRYLDFQAMYLQGEDDDTKWLEITKYRDEAEYLRGLELINNEQEISELFQAFQSLLVGDQKEIREENFIERNNVISRKGVEIDDKGIV